jgi:hypothetical protein
VRRLGTAVVAVLLVVLASLTLVASASGSAPGAAGPGAGTAPLVRPAISPIQRLTLVAGGTASSRSVAHKGKKVGRVAGVCHVPI